MEKEKYKEKKNKLSNLEKKTNEEILKNMNEKFKTSICIAIIKFIGLLV